MNGLGVARREHSGIVGFSATIAPETQLQALPESRSVIMARTNDPQRPVQEPQESTDGSSPNQSGGGGDGGGGTIKPPSTDGTRKDG